MSWHSKDFFAWTVAFKNYIIQRILVCKLIIAKCLLSIHFEVVSKADDNKAEITSTLTISNRNEWPMRLLVCEWTYLQSAADDSRCLL